ncbi:MAG: hypothetical protein ACP5K5_02365 [Candidatus Micrarchaeia archaeon]
MAEDLNFIDLIALSRIKPETVVEKFGGLINSSFFDASNILGSLNQKGLITFTSTFPEQGAITITDLGKQTLQECAEKAKSDLDMLDFTILTQLSGGKRGLVDLAGAVNVRQRDLAMRLYKLAEQQYISYDLRNGNVDISLTEKGFLQVKSGMPKPQQAQAQAQAQPQAQAQAQAGPQAQQASTPVEQTGQAQPTQQNTPQTEGQAIEEQLIKAKKRSIYMIIGAAVAIIIIVIALILIEMKVL